MSMWLVTIANNKRKKQQRMVSAVSADDAGLQVRRLVGGPNVDGWLVICCVPADTLITQKDNQVV